MKSIIKSIFISGLSITCFLSLTACSNKTETQALTQKPAGKISILSTLLAKSGEIVKTHNGYALILNGVDPRTLWFSDRPKRLAGMTKTQTFIAHWAQNFKSSSPNAALSYIDIENNQGKQSVIAATLSNPKVIGPSALKLSLTPLGKQTVKTGQFHWPVIFVDGIGMGNILTIAGTAAATITGGAVIAREAVRSSGDLPENLGAGGVSGELDNQYGDPIEIMPGGTGVTDAASLANQTGVTTDVGNLENAAGGVVDNETDSDLPTQIDGGLRQVGGDASTEAGGNAADGAGAADAAGGAGGD